MKKQLYLDYTREFKSQYGSLTITREDYESLTIPMIAIEFNDEQMQKLVDNINLSMRSDYDEEQLGWLKSYRSNGEGLTKEQTNFADKMSEREFEYFETCAVNMGMRYYEDLSDEEFNELEIAISTLQKQEN